MSIADKLQIIAENEQKVFDAGAKSEYDKFWDSYQENGNRTNYNFAFSGNGWNIETLKPKYDIVPTICSLMFRALNLYVNISSFFEEQGIKLDFSKTTSFSEMCLGSNITGFGVIDTRSANGIDYIFASASKLQTVQLLILKDDGSQGAASSFKDCSSLVNITIQGTIGRNFNLQWSTKLSHDSIVSIVNALSTTTTGLTVTLSKTAVNKAFETAEGLADGSASAEWTTLIATKSNWTISLV
jgi:curved DNA-binding protein CbpA